MFTSKLSNAIPRKPFHRRFVVVGYNLRGTDSAYILMKWNRAGFGETITFGVPVV